jgi:hypothetical protein
MVYLAWLAPKVGSKTGFPKKPMIPQKPQSDQGRERWLDAAYIRRTAQLLLPDGIVFTELVNSRIV